MNTQRLIKLDNKLLKKYTLSNNYMHNIRKFLEELLLDSIYLCFAGLAYLYDIVDYFIHFIKHTYWWVLPMIGWIIYEVLY